MRRRILLIAGLLLAATPAWAGPPYVTDDPDPTPTGQWEINIFTAGTAASGGSFEQTGVNGSYGWSDNLELSFTFASSFDQAPGGLNVGGLSDVQIGAKYRFLRQDDWGIDVAIVPALTLPTHTNAALGRAGIVPSLNLQLEKDWGAWSVFGGGGCIFPHDNLSEDFCLMGGAVTYQITSRFQVGAEIYHATPGARFGLHTTALGFGATYDLSGRYHLLFSAGPGIQNVNVTDGFSWYFAFQITQ